jgi:thiamine biosynthesis lipoprotein
MADGPFFSSLAAAVFLLFFLAACQGTSDDIRVFKDGRLLMGTAVEIQVTAKEESHARRSIRKAFDEIRRIEQKMGWRYPQSDTAGINRAGKDRPVILDREMFGFLERSLRLCRESGGAFNIAVGPLSRLWNFDGESGIVPPPESIRKRQILTDYTKILLDREKLSVRLALAGMSLDLGGIAKGYGVDRAVEALQSEGIASGIVNAGGDMRIFGKKNGNALWHIGIQHPRKKNAVLATLRITDRAVVTSGDYERYFIKGGVRYHHILDTDTGYPSDRCRSVTVTAKSAFLADALATAVFVRGGVKGLKILQGWDGVEGIIVDSDGKISLTENLKEIISLADNVVLSR